MICDRVVLATPTDASAQILRGMVPGAGAALESILYASVAVVSLAYKQQQVARSLSGFGFLAPRSAGLRTLGSVWNSSLFPARAPEGQVLLTKLRGRGDRSIGNQRFRTRNLRHWCTAKLRQF